MASAPSIDNISSDSPSAKTRHMKVISFGISRTGTTSLLTALRQLGFGPIYHGWIMFYRGQMDGDKSEYLWWNNVLAKENNFDTDWEEVLNGPAQRFMAGSRSFLEFAGPFYKEIIHYYRTNPDVKFILTKRDPEKWWKSVKTCFDEPWYPKTFTAWFRYRFCLGLFNPTLCVGLVTVQQLLQRYCGEDAKHTFLRDNEKEIYIDGFNRHNQGVIDFFANNPKYEGRFMVIDLEEYGGDNKRLMKDLKEFLGVEHVVEGDDEYPFVNTATDYTTLARNVTDVYVQKTIGIGVTIAIGLAAGLGFYWHRNRKGGK